jgi:hypothetical protein
MESERLVLAKALQPEPVLSDNDTPNPVMMQFFGFSDRGDARFGASFL